MTTLYVCDTTESAEQVVHILKTISEWNEKAQSVGAVLGRDLLHIEARTLVDGAAEISDSEQHGDYVSYSDKALVFTLKSSIHDFWSSQAYVLAVLIAGFSGAWPYIKLLLLTVCWLWPMPYHRREKLLTLLDQLGKFSFIDSHVTVTMIVAFYFTLQVSVTCPHLI